MTIKVNQNYCVVCNRWEWDETLIKFGAYFYHQTCLDKLNAGLISENDKAMFDKLSKAFNKASTEEA